MRAILALTGVVGLALTVVFALAKIWFLGAASAGASVFCLVKAVRGYHFSYRDDGEP
jgi:hypothetical protein